MGIFTCAFVAHEKIGHCEKRVIEDAGQSMNRPTPDMTGLPLIPSRHEGDESSSPGVGGKQGEVQQSLNFPVIPTGSVRAATATAARKRPAGLEREGSDTIDKGGSGRTALEDLQNDISRI